MSHEELGEGTGCLLWGGWEGEAGGGEEVNVSRLFPHHLSRSEADSLPRTEFGRIAGSERR